LFGCFGQFLIFFIPKIQKIIELAIPKYARNQQQNKPMGQAMIGFAKRMIDE
jgi:hypothetical protein